jgi:hypothetical protein
VVAIIRNYIIFDDEFGDLVDTYILIRHDDFERLSTKLNINILLWHLNTFENTALFRMQIALVVNFEFCRIIASRDLCSFIFCTANASPFQLYICTWSAFVLFSYIHWMRRHYCGERTNSWWANQRIKNNPTHKNVWMGGQRVKSDQWAEDISWAVFRFQTNRRTDLIGRRQYAWKKEIKAQKKHHILVEIGNVHRAHNLNDLKDETQLEIICCHGNNVPLRIYRPCVLTASKELPNVRLWLHCLNETSVWLKSLEDLKRELRIKSTESVSFLRIILNTMNLRSCRKHRPLDCIDDCLPHLILITCNWWNMWRCGCQNDSCYLFIVCLL